MVQTGVQRTFGAALRRFLAERLRNRVAAFGAGLAVTALLQSSTATGLMVAGYAAEGPLGLVPALAAMLGANVGTTLIVQLVSFHVDELAPLLILIGVVMWRRSKAAFRDFGRVPIGLGLLLMSLGQFTQLLAPFADQPSLRTLLGAISDRTGRRKMFVAGSTLLFGIGIALLVHVNTVAGFYVVEAILGLAYGIYIGVDLALVVDVLPNPDDSGKDLGVFNIANALPQTLAPVLAAALLAVSSINNQNYDLMLYTAAAMALIGAVVVLPIKGVR